MSDDLHALLHRLYGATKLYDPHSAVQRLRFLRSVASGIKDKRVRRRERRRIGREITRRTALTSWLCKETSFYGTRDFG